MPADTAPLPAERATTTAPAPAGGDAPGDGFDFGDAVKISLALLIGSDTFSFPAGSIKQFRVDLELYSFEAEVSFFVSCEEVADPMFSSFTTQDLIKATLSVENGRILFDADQASPMIVTGYVLEKRVREVVGGTLGSLPVVGRHYWVRFVDPASAFWRQHRPLELYAQASMQATIDLHKAMGMSITYDWATLQEAQDVLCVGLGGEQPASFYDFVVWFIHNHHGVLELDAGTATYRIGEQKATPGEAAELDEATVAEIRILAPEPVRYTTTVLNPFTEAALLQKELTNTESVTGVAVGALHYTFIADDFNARATIEAARLVPGAHGIEVTFKALPSILWTSGQILTLGDGFSTALYPYGQNYRLLSVVLRGEAAGDSATENALDQTTGTYRLEHVMRLELASDPTPRLPPFVRPAYPVLAEGRVLSASGGAQDRTFYVVEAETTSLLQYRINVPLWNQIVVAPFIPNGETGHMFFPAYKNQRVLVALEFDAARIHSFLEWAIPLSTDTQGDQLVMGFADKNQTIVSHVYQDAKPVLTISRVLAGDQQTWTVSEGDILMVVQEVQVAPAATPTFDVTPNVQAATAQATSAVNGAVSDVTGSYESSMNQVTGGITSAGTDVNSALVAAQTQLTTQISGAEGQLSAVSADAAGAAGALGAAVGSAQAEIQSALTS
jgi:hypothetical protein